MWRTLSVFLNNVPHKYTTYGIDLLYTYIDLLYTYIDLLYTYIDKTLFDLAVAHQIRLLRRNKLYLYGENAKRTGLSLP